MEGGGASEVLCACPEGPAEEVEGPPPCWVWAGPLVAAVAAVGVVVEEEDLLMWEGTRTE